MPRFGFLSKLLTLASNLSNTFLAVIEPYSVATKSKTSFNCLEASSDHSISILVPLLYDSLILNGKWYAKIDIIDGLSLTASLGLHIDNTRQHSVGNKYYGQSASYGGSVMQYSSRVYSLDQQYLLNYKKTFGNHNLDILAGYESMDFNTESHYILGYNMYSDKNWTASNVIDRKNGLAVTMNMPQSVSLHVPATISMKNIMVVFLIVVMLHHVSLPITVGVISGLQVPHG